MNKANKIIFLVLIISTILGIGACSLEESSKKSIFEECKEKIKEQEAQEREYTKMYYLFKDTKTDSVVFESWVVGSIKSIKMIEGDSLVDKVFFESYDSTFYMLDPNKYYAVIEISPDK
jgi:hypothetical protein